MTAEVAAYERQERAAARRGDLCGRARIYGHKTIQEVVTEELIFTGKQAAGFDRQDSRMV